jgi:hypothetical protein
VPDPTPSPNTRPLTAAEVARLQPRAAWRDAAWYLVFTTYVGFAVAWVTAIAWAPVALVVGWLKEWTWTWVIAVWCAVGSLILVQVMAGFHAVPEWRRSRRLRRQVLGRGLAERRAWTFERAWKSEPPERHPPVHPAFVLKTGPATALMVLMRDLDEDAAGGLGANVTIDTLPEDGAIVAVSFNGPMIPVEILGPEAGEEVESLTPFTGREVSFESERMRVPHLRAALNAGPRQE